MASDQRTQDFEIQFVPEEIRPALALIEKLSVGACIHGRTNDAVKSRRQIS